MIVRLAFLRSGKFPATPSLRNLELSAATATQQRDPSFPGLADNNKKSS